MITRLFGWLKRAVKMISSLWFCQAVQVEIKRSKIFLIWVSLSKIVRQSMQSQNEPGKRGSWYGNLQKNLIP
jgi:hypothetical protein